MSISEKLKSLPDRPGVYIYKNKSGEIIYVGKAGSLKRRVGSYFQRAGDVKTERLVSKIFDLETRETPSALEALILEAELIKKYNPKYNIREKDDRSFLYAGITKEKYPKPIIIRKNELKIQNSKFKILFGPFTSPGALREALKILRGIFPWSECDPPVGGRGRPCFYYGIKKCPGVCVGKISHPDYLKNIRNLILFFEGKRGQVIKNLQKEMKDAAAEENFERASEIRNKIYALNHIRDIALIKADNFWVSDFQRKSETQRYNATGRIEGYDISNISGQYAVGSMVVFINGEPKKSEYKKFKIKTVKGANDVAMLREVLSRRLRHNEWPVPKIIFVDGGEGQAAAAREILKKFKLKIPVVGIAKGLSRKNDRFVFSAPGGECDLELERIIKTFPDLFKQIRDEAHRFAITYHRKIRSLTIKK